jgi:arylsulfatase A-like enzyme
MNRMNTPGNRFRGTRKVRTDGLVTALLIPLWLLLAGAMGVRADDAAARPPNVLFLMTDQQTISALGCSGNPDVKTPNLDALAARGVRFEKSYCTYPLCCPGRASLFTSRMPHELGILGNFGAELSKKHVPTMGELFRAAGYETAYAGKWHLYTYYPGFNPKSQKIPGFDVLPLGRAPHANVALTGYGLEVDPLTTAAGVKFLRQPHDKPFLLVFSILNPHDIYSYPDTAALRQLLPADESKLPPARPNWRDTGKEPSDLLKHAAQHPDWTERQWREYLWVYYRLVEKADADLGQAIDALQEAGLAANTVIVFTADHGEMMGAHQMVRKQILYDEADTVPFIVAPPGAKAAVDKAHLVSGLDLLPTLLDYAGIAAPVSLEGRSLRPLIEGKTVPWREFVVSETNSAAVARMLRTDRYKYIFYAEGDHREQFFDLQSDPLEMMDLIADSSLSAEIARHRALLRQWMQDTNDKLGKTLPAAPGQELLKLK